MKIKFLTKLKNLNMENKKTIILGIIAIFLLGGVVWYASQNKEEIANQAASIIGDKGINEKITEVDGDIIYGNPEAPVTIIEYSSHLCGHCADFHIQTLPFIFEEYIKKGKVRFISRLVSHPALSVAILCAYDQDAFWEFNEYLFENIASIQSVDDIKGVAAELKLNQEMFDQCFESDKYEEQVMKWFEQAEKDEAQNTPAFFINGDEIIGAQPYSIFKEAIESHLND